LLIKNGLVNLMSKPSAFHLVLTEDTILFN